MQIAVNEMAFDRQDIALEAKHQLPQILKHWVLVLWASRHDPENVNLGHWKEELTTFMWNVGGMDLTKGNSRATVLKAINEMYFTKMQLQNKSFTRQIQRVAGTEHIDIDCEACSDAFKEALPAIARTMASGREEDIDNYIESLAGGQREDQSA